MLLPLFPSEVFFVIWTTNSMEILVLIFLTWQFDGKLAFKIAFLNDQDTLEISPSHFWFRMSRLPFREVRSRR